MSQKWNVEFFNIRRNGTNSQHVLQRISSMIAQKHDKTLQQDPRLDQLQTELLTLPQRSKIQHSPPYNIPRHNGPSQPWTLAPSTLNWTHIHSNQVEIQLYLHLIDWISTVKNFSKKRKENSTVVKIISASVKINFHGGKNHFFPLVSPANFPAGYACTHLIGWHSR